MTGHTASGFPYPLPADALIDYPAVGQELALRLEPIVPWTPITTWGSGYSALAPDPNLLPAFMLGANRRAYLRGLVTKATYPSAGEVVCTLTPATHLLALATESFAAVLFTGSAPQPFALRTIAGAATIQIAAVGSVAWPAGSYLSLSGLDYACT